MKLLKHAKNIHEIKLEGTHAKIAMLSDLHWDNPKCDRETLKRNLNYCVKESIPIMINGDMFCLMQGRGDNRRNKSDIRREHINSKYLDSIVETAVDWWSPYSHLLTVIGYGNHETSIIKFQETDILARFVKLLNLKNNTNVQVGGYGGWLWFTINYYGSKKSLKLKYFHGSGGGGIVTKGAINITRALQMYEADIFTMGHIHENSSRTDAKEVLHTDGSIAEVKHKYIHSMITGTYKDEYKDGFGGWHVERGAPVKTLGGRILTIKTSRRVKNKIRKTACLVDSYKFPV